MVLTQNSETELDKEKLDGLDGFIDNLAGDLKESSLIIVLHKAQEIFGYLPNELQLHIAAKLCMPASMVYGVVTFYSFFNTEPKGEYKINVCLGTACFVRGAQAILEKFQEELDIGAGETTEDGLFSLDAIRCVGACGLAPVVSVNDQMYGRVTLDEVKEILEKYMAEGGTEVEDGEQ